MCKMMCEHTEPHVDPVFELRGGVQDQVRVPHVEVPVGLPRDGLQVHDLQTPHLQPRRLPRGLELLVLHRHGSSTLHSHM